MTDLVDLQQLGYQIAGLQGKIQSVQAQNELPGILTQMLGILEEQEMRLRNLEPNEDWYCPTCDASVSGETVTFEQVHEVCGTQLNVEVT